VELQGQVKQLRDQGLGLAAISYDSPEIIAAFSRQHGITYPMLSDAGSATIKRYGILNPVPEQLFGPNGGDPAMKADVEKYVSVVGASARMVGIAFPGTFMLDRQGRVTSRYFEDFYIERSTTSSLLVKLGQGTPPVTATKISTSHLDVTTYPSDEAVAPGNRFSLVLEVEPRPRMHVYAPGAKDYRVVSLNVTEQPFVRLLPVAYPPSEIYFFEPLNERVPVYQKPFTLVREVVLEGQPEAQAAFRGKETLTISGSLDYQACDDKICFNPVSLPLSWRVTLRPIVRGVPRPQ
jgi:peroxiredoxin